MVILETYGGNLPPWKLLEIQVKEGPINIAKMVSGKDKQKVEAYAKQILEEVGLAGTNIIYLASSYFTTSADEDDRP